MYKKKRTILDKKGEWNEIMANEMCISVNVVAKLCDFDGDRLMRGGECVRYRCN